MKDYTHLNTTRKEVVQNMLIAAFGLFIFGIGVYLTIHANIGVAPWDVLNQGLAKHIPISYGTVMMLVSLTVIVLDVLMKEPIGMGMLLDTVVVGKTVDLMNWLDPVPLRQTVWGGVLLLVAGSFVLAFLAAGFPATTIAPVRELSFVLAVAVLLIGAGLCGRKLMRKD